MPVLVPVFYIRNHLAPKPPRSVQGFTTPRLRTLKQGRRSSRIRGQAGRKGEERREGERLDKRGDKGREVFFEMKKFQKGRPKYMWAWAGQSPAPPDTLVVKPQDTLVVCRLLRIHPERSDQTSEVVT